jgi:multidrug efflux pump subunit AcrB
MPEGVQLSLWRDESRVLAGRFDLLKRNGIAGLVLVFIVLALFLKLRLAFWVAVGIPVSFLGAMWLMPTLDVSFNMVSLFAFILVLGIVVDDAIVVGESIYTEQDKGGDSLRGAIRGTRLVSVPVIFAVLTTVAAFLPMAFLPDVMGKFIRVIPLIVIPTLLFSLIESQLVLPAHLAHRRKREPTRPGVLSRVQGFFASGLAWVASSIYRPVVELALRWRYATIAIFLSVFLLTVGLVAGGRVDFTFFPKIESDHIVAQLTMPQGVPYDETADAVRRIEAAVLRMSDELNAEHGVTSSDRGAIRNVIASVGEQPITSSASSGRFGASGSHVGEVVVELAPSEERAVGSNELSRRWRELVGDIPNVVDLSYVEMSMSVGKPIDIQISGLDLDELRAASDALKEKLASYPGVFDITDSFRMGKREVKLSVKPGAEALGITLSDLARQVRQGFHGEEAQRVQRGRDDVAVMVRYTSAERHTLAGLENMRIRTPGGAEVPFSAVAEARYGRGFSAIPRTDRKRTIRVSADIDQSVANANKIMADLSKTAVPGILKGHPGVRFEMEGEQKEQAESMAALMRGFLISLVMIYAFIAVPFKSYSQPIVIMATIPFGLVGAIWGHVLMGMDLSVMSSFGMVALAGVTVNDGLVLVDYVNMRRREGDVPLLTALREAGLRRFRPITLTSMTTFAGLSPILLERSLQAKFLMPMAVSLAFGVLFSTLITLVLVPAGYLVLEDVKGLFARKPAGSSLETRSVEAGATASSKMLQAAGVQH